MLTSQPKSIFEPRFLRDDGELGKTLEISVRPLAENSKSGRIWILDKNSSRYLDFSKWWGTLNHLTCVRIWMLEIPTFRGGQMQILLQDSEKSLPICGTLIPEAFSNSDCFFKLAIGSLLKTFQLKYASWRDEQNRGAYAQEIRRLVKELSMKFLNPLARPRRGDNSKTAEITKIKKKHWTFQSLLVIFQKTQITTLSDPEKQDKDGFLNHRYGIVLGASEFLKTCRVTSELPIRPKPIV